MNRLSRAVFAALAVLVLLSSSGRAAENAPAVAALGAERLAAEDAAAPMQFAIVGDRTGGCRAGVFEQAVERAGLLGPDFVMSIGDFIEGGTEDEAVLQTQWDEFVALAGRLEAPFFLLPGNHDISNPTMAKKWRERFGPSYYHFVHRGVLFLCLSTEDPPRGHMSAEQADYVARALAENRNVRWTFVFMHQPLWRDEEQARKEGRDAGTGWPAIEAILADRPYTLFAGHTHTYTYEERGGHEYIIVATCGGASSLAGPAAGQFDHVTWVTMTDQGPRIAVLALDGLHDKRVATAESIQQYVSLLGNFDVEAPAVRAGDGLFESAEAEILVRNGTDAELLFQGVFDLEEKVVVEPQRLSLSVPPKGSERVAVRLTAVKPFEVTDPEPIVLRWAAEHRPEDGPPIRREGTTRLMLHNEKPLACPRAEGPVTVDGRLDDWPALPCECTRPIQVRHDPATWHGPEDGRFRFGVAYDDAFLYIAVEVTDDAALGDPSLTVWSQDGVEIRLDARAAAERGPMPEEWTDALPILLSPGRTPEAPVVWEPGKLPEGTRVACVRTETGFAAEVAVPSAYLDARQGDAWKTFRLNVAVDDFDPSDIGGAQLWWRPDWRSEENLAPAGTFERK